MTVEYAQEGGYQRTQSVIYQMQETLLNASKDGVNGTDDLQKLAATESSITVNSERVLSYVSKNYGFQRRNLGTLRYSPLRQGRFEGSEKKQELPFPYNYCRAFIPEPFLPRLGTSAINSIITVILTSEDLQIAIEKNQNIRFQNRELWGVDIYTCDSDPLLALVHCGALDFKGSSGTRKRRTPANLENPDNVVSLFDDKPPLHSKSMPGFDLEVQLLMLPPLQRYCSVERYGIKSRAWEVIHDGLSYGIYSIRVNPRAEDAYVES
ncbi:HCL208Wp [Eremothecium sinecaudum]|uniref:HCL208Wp n=1 Tax=Eremothecium sinecaudum TaxID=45286 RepID=A0A0X8HR86_9SACH|nr:HCL208Wp [Eremothecium sinecaudum]AMD19943.1 HCL208Wp [Eremothecium sinecaudum]